MIPDAQIDELRDYLAARTEQVCEHLLRGGKKKGKKWICGGVDGGAGSSMDVVLEGEKAGLWIDRATGEAGDLIQLWILNQGLKFQDAVRTAAEFVGYHLDENAPPSAARAQRINPRDYIMAEPPPMDEAQDGPPPASAEPPWAATPIVDWQACVERMTNSKIEELCAWRSYSRDMVEWMVANELVGVYNGSFAFPVHDKNGTVVRIHYRLPKKGWAYFPTGGNTAPLIVGNPQHAIHTLVCESQWDAFALLDKLNAHDPQHMGTFAAVITRGASSNLDISKIECRELIACPQNDPDSKRNPKTGRTPAEEWLAQIQESKPKKTAFAVFETPAGHADANDWIRDYDPEHVEVFKLVIEGAKNPILKNVRTVKQLLNYPITNDPNALIGCDRRFLSKGSSWLFIGPSGIGKSTLVIDMAAYAATGLPWHGIKFRKPMKVLVIQAENDEGDLAEMLVGRMKYSYANEEFSKAQIEMLEQNLMFQQTLDKTGNHFIKWLKEIIVESKADMVIVDPMLSYVGDDISQQKVAGAFLREGLQPILQETGCILMLVHHTGKPPSDGKSRAHWSDSDYSYLGLGSSELVNWARAVAVIVGTKESGTFQFRITKRGDRAGLVDFVTGMKTKEIYLRHGTEKEGQVWLQTQRPEEDPEPEKKGRSRPKELPTVEDALRGVKPCMSYLDLLKAVRGEGGLTVEQGKRMISELQLGGYIRKDLDGLFYRCDKTD